MRIGLAKSIAIGCFSLTTAVHAQDTHAEPVTNVPSYAATVPTPTFANVRYGKHERHVLDFWKADSDKPTPLVFVIHGGGWKQGSKERLHSFVDTPDLLKAGISVAAINYRLMMHTEGVDSGQSPVAGCRTGPSICPQQGERLEY